MARTHGRIFTDIWSDPDFLALDWASQRLYLFLLSQSDLSHAGLVPMRIRRWARTAADGSENIVRDAITALSEARFIVADEDTEEVLIRTFVRNDGVWKQPKVMVRMRIDARQITSDTLREAFAAELDRLPLDQLSDEPSGKDKDGPSTRQYVSKIVDELRSDFADSYPTERVSDTPPDTPRVRAGAFHLPPTTSTGVELVTEPHQGETPVDNRPPIQICGTRHLDAQDCRGCARQRQRNEIAERRERGQQASTAGKVRAREAQEAIDACDLCDDKGRSPNGMTCPHIESAPMPEGLRELIKASAKTENGDDE